MGSTASAVGGGGGGSAGGAGGGGGGGSVGDGSAWIGNGEGMLAGSKVGLASGPLVVGMARSMASCPVKLGVGAGGWSGQARGHNRPLLKSLSWLRKDSPCCWLN